MVKLYVVKGDVIMFEKIFNFLFLEKNIEKSKLTVIGKNRDIALEERKLNLQVKRNGIKCANEQKDAPVYINKCVHIDLASYFSSCKSLAPICSDLTTFTSRSLR